MSNFWSKPLEWKDTDVERFEKNHHKVYNCPDCEKKPIKHVVVNISRGYGGQTWTFRFRCPDNHEWNEKVYFFTD